MYPEKTTDKIMIPQWEYRKLRDIATRVDVLLAEIDAEVIRHETEGYKYEAEFKASYIKRILAPHREVLVAEAKDVSELPPAFDDLASLGYTE